jgi:ATP-dependent Lon protease
MVIPLFVGRPKSIKAMESAMEAGKSILLVAQKSAAKDDPGPQDMYEIGCISSILQMLKLPDGTVKVLVEGGTRARIEQVIDLRTHWGRGRAGHRARAGAARRKSKRCAARCCRRSTST